MVKRSYGQVEAELLEFVELLLAAGGADEVLVEVDALDLPVLVELGDGEDLVDGFVGDHVGLEVDGVDVVLGECFDELDCALVTDFVAHELEDPDVLGVLDAGADLEGGVVEDVGLREVDDFLVVAEQQVELLLELGVLLGGELLADGALGAGLGRHQRRRVAQTVVGDVLVLHDHVQRERLVLQDVRVLHHALL